MRLHIAIIFCLATAVNANAQCNYDQWDEQTPVISDYVMDVQLDHNTKTARCTQRLIWKNTSPDTIYEIPFYMYLNAFKNMQSSYLKGSGGAIFGRNLSNNTMQEWGWIEIDEILDQNGNHCILKQEYIQKDDGNKDDQSVSLVTLKKPILPGSQIVLDIRYEAKLPFIISRAGYSKNDYFFFNHWYPQPGVYELNATGEWGWNCHQFFRGTEFFADFGHYEVNLTLDQKFVIGATGCKVSETNNPDGTITYKYIAKNVIDFAWIAYPMFEEYTDRHLDVDIKLLIPEEHCMMVPRYLEAVKYAMDYLTEHVGTYPYPSITICDPPLHGLRSGLMEYPMLITCGSFYNFPKGICTVESLVIHEFTHMYFMATLASNEKEEAWLDEGFVTFYEDKIMDHYYGPNSLLDIGGYTSSNSENTRLEYTGMSNPSEGSIARPGWEIKGDYKGLIYAKTATMLRTLEGMLGPDVFERLIKTYYQEWKFKHPKEANFRAIADRVCTEQLADKFGSNLDWFFDPCLHGVETLDYFVKSIQSRDVEDRQGVFGDYECKSYQYTQVDDYYASFVVANKGNLELPVDIKILFQDQQDTTLHWDGQGREYSASFRNKEISAVLIDPFDVLPLDMNVNNNSLVYHPDNSQTNLAIYDRVSNFLFSVFELSLSVF